MLVTISIPDSLPDERVRQRVMEIEESLRKEAEFLKKITVARKSEKTDAELFLESFGSWKDDRSAEEIIDDIYSARNSVEREIQL